HSHRHSRVQLLPWISVPYSRAEDLDEKATATRLSRAIQRREDPIKMRPFLLLGITFLMTPTSLWADDGSGTISGTIGETQVNVSIWTEQSDFYGDGNSGGVSIMTRPVARDDGLGALAIGFEGSDFAKGALTSFEISIGDVAAESRSEYFADLDQDLQVVIT